MEVLKARKAKKKIRNKGKGKGMSPRKQKYSEFAQKMKLQIQPHI